MAKNEDTMGSIGGLKVLYLEAYCLIGLKRKRHYGQC